MASIIKQYNGKVIKNAGDCLIYYFPKTVGIINSNNNNNYNNNNEDKESSALGFNKTTTTTSSFTKRYNNYSNNKKISKESAFEDVIECGMAMIQANSILNANLHKNGLPPISYRISANYGLVELATSTNSNVVDLFGPTVNICSKINHLAMPNQMVIYKDLYDVIKEIEFFKEYTFEEIKDNNKNNFGNIVKSIYSVNFINKEKTKKDNNINNQEHKKDGSPQKPDNLDSSSYKILLIDDNEDILFLFASVLEGEGYTTKSISNSMQALNYFSQIDPYHYDLIVMDVRMPGINGIQLYSKIKLMNPDIKVLFLSALDAVEELLSIYPEVKRSQIINKTIDLKKFTIKVKETLITQ